jgi:AcrR family transcriptional regulator
VAEAVKPKRRYDSTRRRQQAAATRADILRAAQAKFEADGYVATTMAAIAEEAGVSLKTVYLTFETKAGLLRAVWDVLLRGERDLAVAQLPWYQEVLAERDPERKLRLVARSSRAVKERIGGMLVVLREAAPVDPDAGVLWALIQTDFHDNQRAIVRSLPAGALRADLDETTATDLLWTLNHPDVWQLLVVERGWTPDRFEAWFADAACAQLLTPRKPRRGRAVG